MADAAVNPYVGPRTFTYAERERFFGREREARDLLSLVISERLVLFYAQSGAGKSSLINTRLVPKLKAAGYAVLPIARVGGDLPEGFPGGRIHDVEGALPAASTPVAVDEQAKIFIHQTRSLAWL